MISYQPNPTKYDNNCIINRSRYGIKPSEKWTIMGIMVVYIVFCLISMKNIIIAYKNGNNKTFKFLPKINVQLFAALYSRILFFMDVIPFFFNGFQAGDYLYNDVKILKFLEALSFSIWNLISVYSSIIWMELVCFIKKDKLKLQRMKKIIRLSSIFVVILLCIYIIIAGLQINLWRSNIVGLCTIFATTFIQAISSAIFQWNIGTVIQVGKQKSGRRIIIVCFLSLVFRIVNDILETIGTTEHIKVVSCYKDTLIQPMYIFFVEILQQLVPVISFMTFFSPTMLETGKVQPKQKSNNIYNKQRSKSAHVTHARV